MYVGSFISSIGQEIKVRATNGLFTRQVFTKKGNEQLVKDYVNIFIQYILEHNSKSSLELLGDNIEITAEYNYYTKSKGINPSQDFKVKDGNKLLYLEIQTEVDKDNPLYGRALMYYALSFVEAIGTKFEKKNQLWLCIKCEDSIVNNELAFEEYSLLGNTTGRLYPKTSSISIIDLSKLSSLNIISDAVDLAKYLIYLQEPLRSKVKDISEKLQFNFEELKKDKERITELEEFNLAHYEGLSEGRAEGLAKGREEGRKEGFEEGIAKGVLYLYKEVKNIDLILNVYKEKSKLEIEQILKDGRLL